MTPTANNNNGSSSTTTTTNNKNNNNNGSTTRRPSRFRRAQSQKVRSGGILRNSFSMFETIRSNPKGVTAQDVDTRQSNQVQVGMVKKIPMKGIDEDEEETTVDLSSVTTKEDLKNLWASDPFLYYSIPEIHKNAYKLNDEDSDESEDEEIYGTSPSGMPHRPKVPVQQSQNQQQQPPTQPAQQNQKEQSRLSDEPLARRTSSSSMRNLSCPAGMLGMSRLNASFLYFDCLRVSACPCSYSNSFTVPIELANADISYALFHGQTPIVIRRQRLSTEAHPSLIVDDFIVSDDDSSLGADGEDDFDDEVEVDEMIRGVLQKITGLRVMEQE